MSNIWWPPRAIIFTREQVIWLFEHLPSIREGRWPPQPSSYDVETRVQRSRSRHAPFETPVAVAAELLIRLENAGQDGAMCKMEFVYGESRASIARHWHTTEERVGRRIERALDYCCGLRRRKVYEQRRR